MFGESCEAKKKQKRGININGVEVNEAIADTNFSCMFINISQRHFSSVFWQFLFSSLDFLIYDRFQSSHTFILSSHLMSQPVTILMSIYSVVRLATSFFPYSKYVRDSESRLIRVGSDRQTKN